MIGRQYQKKLNSNARPDSRYRSAVFVPATAYGRCLLPYYESIYGVRYNFMGNQKNVRVKLSRSDVERMLQNWANCTIVGEEKKGEETVTYFGRNVIFTYSFVTNQMALKFGVTNDAAQRKAKEKSKKKSKSNNKDSKSKPKA